MSNTFTTVTNESWFSRIKSAFGGIIVGIVFVIVAFGLLFWNEGRAVKRYKTLKEGGGLVQTVPIDDVNPDFEGKLVHMTGTVECEEILEDSTFGVSEQAIALRRSVEMYQWDEDSTTKTKKKVGGGTKKTKTYSYEKEWSSKLKDSSEFAKPEGHTNPSTMPYEQLRIYADIVMLGAFNLSSAQISAITNWQDLRLGSEFQLPGSMGDNVRLHDGGLYIGADPAAPAIGDVRIKFKAAYPTDVSLIAQQAGRTFQAFQTDAGGKLLETKTGIHTSDAMIQQAQESNKMMTWILRLVGFIVMVIGFGLVFRVASVLADVIPFFGNIVGFGTSVIAFFLAAILSVGTIGVAWVTYRPLIGIPILLVGVGLIVLLVIKLKGAKKQAGSA